MRRQHQSQGESPNFRVRAVGAPTPDWDALQALLEYVYKLGQERGSLSPGPGSPPASGRASSVALQLTEFAARVAARAQNVTNASGAIIALTARGGDIVCVGRAGLAPEIGARLDPNWGLSGKCVRSGEPQVCLDAASDPRVNEEACRDLGIRSMAMVPLRRHGAVVGLLSAFSDKPSHFDQHDLGALKYLEGVVIEELDRERELPGEQAAAVAAEPPALQVVAAQPAASHPPDEPLATPAGATEPSLPEASAEQPGASESLPETPGILAEQTERPAARRGLSIVVVFAVLLLVGAVAWRTGIFRRGAAAPAPQPSAPNATQPNPSSSEAPPANSLNAATAAPAADGITRLRSIEHWSGPGATRVTMLLDGPVKYQAYRLRAPERIYFDLHGVRLSPELVHHKTLSDQSALLSEIRVARFDANTVRVVLDLKGPYRYSAVLLSNPSRLLVEIFDKVQGPAQPATGARGSAAPSEKHEAGAKSRMANLLKGLRIVIDPGHGGIDLGTVGPGGLQEKQLALDISQRLAKLLQAALGAEVILTRADDRYLGLEARTQIANQAHADLFISIHGNSSQDRAVGGIETYFSAAAAPGARSLKGVSLTEAAELGREDRQFARDVQQALYADLAKTSHLRNRGVRTAPLVVLKDAAMPAILVEISFLSSPAEEQKLHSSDYRQQIAAALCRGIVRHVATMQRAPQTTLAQSGK